MTCSRFQSKWMKENFNFSSSTLLFLSGHEIYLLTIFCLSPLPFLIPAGSTASGCSQWLVSTLEHMPSTGGGPSAVCSYLTLFPWDSTQDSWLLETYSILWYLQHSRNPVVIPAQKSKSPPQKRAQMTPKRHLLQDLAWTPGKGPGGRTSELTLEDKSELARWRNWWC